MTSLDRAIALYHKEKKEDKQKDEEEKKED